jgi:hypothetical protein
MLFEEHSEKADFVSVYIKEAHAVNDFHMEKFIDFEDPKTLE